MLEDPFALISRLCYLCFIFCVSLMMLMMALNFNEYLIETFSDYNVVIENWKLDIMLQLRVSQNECEM